MSDQCKLNLLHYCNSLIHCKSISHAWNVTHDLIKSWHPSKHCLNCLRSLSAALLPPLSTPPTLQRGLSTEALKLSAALGVNDKFKPGHIRSPDNHDHVRPHVKIQPRLLHWYSPNYHKMTAFDKMKLLNSLVSFPGTKITRGFRPICENWNLWMVWMKLKFGSPSDQISRPSNVCFESKWQTPHMFSDVASSDFFCRSTHSRDANQIWRCSVKLAQFIYFYFFKMSQLSLKRYLAVCFVCFFAWFIATFFCGSTNDRHAYQIWSFDMKLPSAARFSEFSVSRHQLGPCKW